MPASTRRLDLAASLPVAVLAGGALAITARLDATALLVAVALVQALLAPAWVLGTTASGTTGSGTAVLGTAGSGTATSGTGARDRVATLLPGLLAAAGADVCVARWPHGQLGTVLVVVALCVPVMYAAQLLRGAARTRVAESLGSAALLVVAEAALPALVQLRHEYARTDGAEVGGQVVFGVAVVLAGALAIGYVVDLLVAAPRFDPAVPRGLLAVLASTGLGGSLGYLLLQGPTLPMLHGGRGAALGAALGAVVALAAVGAAFVEHGAAGMGAVARRWGAALSALVPLAVLAPVAFVLALALRT